MLDKDAWERFSKAVAAHNKRVAEGKVGSPESYNEPTIEEIRKRELSARRDDL